MRKKMAAGAGWGVVCRTLGFSGQIPVIKGQLYGQKEPGPMGGWCGTWSFRAMYEQKAPGPTGLVRDWLTRLGYFAPDFAPIAPTDNARAI